MCGSGYFQRFLQDLQYGKTDLAVEFFEPLNN